METRHAHIVREIAETGRFSKAAERLGMGQSALSKIVMRIEDEFGFKVFDRGPQGAALTPFGRLFLEYATVLERETRDLKSVATSMRKGQSGHFRIGAGQTWVSDQLPEIFVRMHRQRPGLRISVFTGSVTDILARLKSGQIDLAFTAMTVPLGPALCSENLTYGQLRVVARPGHPLARLDRPCRFHEMMGYDWVVGECSESDLTWNWLTSTAQNRGLPKPNVILETPQRDLATQALINSDLLGFQPRNAKAVRTGQLAVISEVRVARMRATGMVWRKNRQIPSGLHFIMETARAFIADRDAGMEPSDSLEHER